VIRRRPAATLTARALSAACMVALALAPARAWALCPNCLGQHSALTPTLKLIGLFLLLPFLVAGAIYAVVRRAVYGRWSLPGRGAPASLPTSEPSAPSALASSDGGVQAG
jgi:hypothetical protein